MKTVCRYLFPSLRNLNSGIAVYSKNALILGSESVNMLIRGAVAAMCVVRNNSSSTPTVFLSNYNIFAPPLSLLCASKVATELRTHNSTVFHIVVIFVSFFQHFLVFEFNENYPTCFRWILVFNGEHRFALYIIANVRVRYH